MERKIQLPPLSPPDGITDFLLTVWKRRLCACAVRRAHVSKHFDTACAYRYHHCVSQYRWYRIFGIGIGPSLPIGVHFMTRFMSDEPPWWIRIARPQNPQVLGTFPDYIKAAVLSAAYESMAVISRSCVGVKTFITIFGKPVTKTGLRVTTGCMLRQAVCMLFDPGYMLFDWTYKMGMY